MRDPLTRTRVVLATPREELASTVEARLRAEDAIESVSHVGTPRALRMALEEGHQGSRRRVPIVILDLEARDAFGVLEERSGDPGLALAPFLGLVGEHAHERARRAYDLQINACLASQGTPDATADVVAKAVAFWARWSQLPDIDLD